MPTYILGITAYGRNSAAALICDGRIVAAAQEERFSRISNDSAFPANALQYCLDEAGIDGGDIAVVAINAPRGEAFKKLADASIPALSKILGYCAANPLAFLQKLLLASEMKKALGDTGWLAKLSLAELPASHAASAFFPSPYYEALVLTLEGDSEDGAPIIVAAATGKGNRLVDIEIPVAAGRPLTKGAFLQIAQDLSKQTGQKNLCLAGDAAPDCMVNVRPLIDNEVFENIWTQPAAGDAGAALGAALHVWHGERDEPRTLETNQRDAMQGGYLGPAFSQQEIERRLAFVGASFKVANDNDLLELAVDDLMAGRAVAWFQGRMEFGSRALGGRSILGDARSVNMQRTLHMRVKYDNPARWPDAAVLCEDATEWFEIDTDSPYMLLAANVTGDKQAKIPAVSAGERPAQLLTVHEDVSPAYHALIRRFKSRTGCPVVASVGFNLCGEPIVCTPEDAFRCFMSGDLETLVIGNCYLRKEDQNMILRKDYKSALAQD